MPAVQYAQVPDRKETLRERRFSPADQCWFATYAGDINPIHVAPHKAGRTHTGEMVVHGAHVALWLLEEIAVADPHLEGLGFVSVRFLKPCHVGDAVSPEILCQESGVIAARAFVDGAPILEMEILPALRAAPLDYRPLDLSLPDKPACFSLDAVEAQSGEVGLPQQGLEARRHFPQVTERLGMAVPALFAALSQLVGMHCPGLYSLFSSFTLTFEEADAPLPGKIGFRVTRWDPRFRLATMAVASGKAVHGTVRAFLREDRIDQPSMKDIARRISGKPYAGRKILIVGGSRGLGETSAKLLAGGGADVTLTYRFARDDAERVACEIRESGGECRAWKFDVLSPPKPQLACVPPQSAVLYFATPAIGVRRLKWFDPALLKVFEDYYVSGFALLCEALAEWDRPVQVLYPSTSFLDRFETDMLEYLVAKSAGEALCRRIPELYPHLGIWAPRLPRLATDQNAGFLPGASEPVFDVLHPILDRMLEPPADVRFKEAVA